MFRFNKDFLEKCNRKNSLEIIETKRKKLPCDSLTYTTGDPDYNIAQFNAHAGLDAASENSISVDLAETKSEKKRYYLKPQNIYIGTKRNLLKALLALGNEDSTIYTLNNLEDNTAVEKLGSDDIIYRLKNGVLYDKNDVRVWDYDLSIKKEEKRPKITKKPNFNNEKVAKAYSDRLTIASLKEDLNTDFLSLSGQKDPYTRTL